jgi:hypothetical protein
MLPFFRQGVVLEDSLNGTNRLAGPTINALYGVDVELTRLTEGFRLVLRRMNAVNRTDIHTGGIFYIYAGFSNRISQKPSSLKALDLPSEHKLFTKTSLGQEISTDDLNVIGQYIQPETVIPLNIYKVTAEIFHFVLDGPFS